jgi:hypothetical protein
MSIGALTLNTANINAIAGAWSTSLKQIFSQAITYKASLDNIGLAGLQLAPYNMTATDAQALINMYNDLNTLGKVYYGTNYVAPGATVNSGVPTANDGTHFGYNFDISIGKAAGIGF